MRLVFAGTPAVAIPSLRRLLDSPRHEVAAVVTRPDRPAGRGRHIARSPVAELADEAGVEVLAPERPRDPDFLSRLTAIAADCAPVVAYGALLPKAALDIPRHGWVNLHFSLLPAYRGAAPVQRAVLAGEDITGASVFQIEEGLDSGPVFGTLTERVRPRDTSGDLLERLAVVGAELLLATMDGIEDGVLEPRPQPADGVTIAPKLTVEEVRVDWTLPDFAIDRLVRAATPAPGAWTTFRDARVKLAPVRPAAGAVQTPLPPGQLVIAGKDTVAVGTGTTAVLLGEVRPEGKAPMPAAAWARGIRPTDGEAFA
ncbi:methionyl-tRNA formyltransferase [Frankia sp. AgB1.9]|uniref:methionyl-tRNA formyltransferase n=1 Tax=unclassified Frankia TaxID=2632575 RepID=UPI001933BB62|nr:MULTISPECIES: methionyl-tRNA formyltransferase [unclassified Frankia]MBL7493777.1 methionyl-tRNA formyltransferase [Frankia sp. AgW1.1]MBL7549099.1 methionyl-tRNA formyltransferase [Frankia sp. AgB1.9]MBL7619738.1 methionyl-tRNA formyltransferase [Frankia sp. AgB1.8]